MYTTKQAEQLCNEYIAVVMSKDLLMFCKDNELPFSSADELIMRPELSDEQYGFLFAYITIWDSLISA